MSYESIVSTWKLFTPTPPSHYILYCKGRFYAVIDDKSSIVSVMSKSDVVYNVSKSRLTVEKSEEGYEVYNLEDPRYLKVVSCTDNTNVKPVQKFVRDNILRFMSF